MPPGPARPPAVGWSARGGPGPWRGWWPGRRGRCRGAARARTRCRRRPGSRPPARARPGSLRSLGLGFLRRGLGLLAVLRARGIVLLFRRLLGRLVLRLPGPFAVFAVIGDVEAASLEDEPGAPRDDPGRRLAADRALGAGLLGDLLEFLELMPFGAA